MVGVLFSRSSGLALSPGWGNCEHCVLGQDTLLSEVSAHPGVLVGIGQFYARGNPHPIKGQKKHS